MKSLELLEKHYAVKEEKKGTGSPKGKIPLLKKMDLLYEMYNEIKAQDKKALGTFKKRIVTILDSIADEGAGAMLSRILGKVHEELFEQVERSRLPQFFDREMQILASSKIEPSHKITHLYLTGRIYQRFASGMMMSAPTNDLINAVFKFQRASTEWYAKESAFTCIRRIIKGKSSTLSNHWADLLKNLGKNTTDKSVEVRLQVAKCFKEASKSMRGTVLTQYYDQIYYAAIKGFEDDQKCVQEQYVATLAAAMVNKLQESLSEKAFNLNSKKKPAEPPKNLLDVYNAFQSLLTKEKDSIKECSVLCIWHVMKSCPEYIKQTKPLLILQLKLTWLARTTTYTYENYKARIYLGWLFIEYMKLLDLSMQIKLMEIILSNLEKIVEKHEKNQQQANENQIIIIISALNALILQLGPHIVEHNPSVNHITDIIVPFLSWERPPVRVHAAECIKSLVYRCKPWVCQLLSLFLNMTTVAHAELAALPPAPLFTGPKAGVMEKENLYSYYTSLSVQSSCLGSLLHGTELLLSGVPLDIANSAFVSAKGIILGYCNSEEEETKLKESPEKHPEAHKEKELIAKKHAGWIIIQGLLGLGSTWVSGNLTALIKLWNYAFTKESCTITEDQKSNIEHLAQEFVVKAEALTALHDFMINYKDLMNPQVIKFIANALVNCTQYMLYNPTKEPKKQLFDLFPVKYLQMRAELYDSLSIMPSHTYEETYIPLLHALAETITASNVVPTLYKYWEANDELLLISKDDQTVWREESVPVSQEAFAEEADAKIYNSPYQLAYMQNPDTTLKMRAIDSAIKLYANVFCSSHLSHKNRIQLCKHLQAHLTQANGEGSNKQFTIVLTCFAIIRHLAKSPSTCELLPEPDQIFALLRSIIEIACTMSNQNLRTLGCELVALLEKTFNETVPSLLATSITELTKLSESTDLLTRTKGILILGYLFKHFEPEKLQPYMKKLEAIISIHLKDSHVLSKFYGLFALYIIIKYTGSTFPQILDQNLMPCLHNYNTDIRLDKSVFSLMCRIFELIVRLNPASAQGKLQIMGFDGICLSHCNHPLVSTSILQYFKYCSINDIQVTSMKQCADIVVKHYFNPYTPLTNKKLCLEIMGILVNQGHYKHLKQVNQNLVWEMLNELNNIKIGRSNSSYRYDKRLSKKMLKLDSFQLDLEKSLNLKGTLESNTQTRLSELVEKSEDILYGYGLKQVIILLFQKLIEEKGGIKEVIDIAKYVVEYRIIDEEAPEGKSSPDKEGIVTKEKKKSENAYKFNKSIVIGTKSFIIKLLSKLIKEEEREEELVTLLGQFPNLLSLSFAFISVESNPYKSYAFKLIRTAIKGCKNIKDMVAPLNEEEETTDIRAGLEQYEAQINTLIRQYMTKNSSYSTLNNIFSIIYYFFKIPISRDTNTMQKLIQQLVEPLREMTVTSTVEFSCEKHALECHFKRIKMLCKLYFSGKNIPHFDTFLKGSLTVKSPESSFLRPADRQRILSLFTPEVEALILKHMVAAFNDCWVILTQNKKIARQKNNYMLIHSGTPCAYSTYVCESAVIYFLKYLSITTSSSASQTVISQHLHTLLPFALHYISKKPQIKSSSEIDAVNVGGIKSKLALMLKQKEEMLAIISSFMQIPNLDITEELLAACLDCCEKVTEMKIQEFNSHIVTICSFACANVLANSKIVHFGKLKLISTIEEIFGKIWMQTIQPRNNEETNLFLLTYTSWKKILLQYYAQVTDCSSQFNLTFNTLVTSLTSAIPESEIGYAKIVAKLSIGLIKELLAIPNCAPFVKTTVSQYLHETSTSVQHFPQTVPGDKLDIMVIIALNCAISLSPMYCEETAKSFASLFDLLENQQIQSQMMKTTMAIVKASAGELKNSAFAALMMEHLLQDSYKMVEQHQGNTVNITPKLQLILTLYQVIGITSESLFNILFSLYLSLCSATFPNTVLKDAINCLTAIMSLNPVFFKAAVGKLDSREVKYLQLLMRLNAANQIE